MICIQQDGPPVTLDLALIERGWQQLLKARQLTENATLCRLHKFDEATGRVFVIHDITYKDVVGYRAGDNRLNESVPFMVVSALARIKTSDGNLVLRERDSGDWPHSLELPGGFIRATAPEIDTDEFIKERVAHDLHIPTEMIMNCTFEMTLPVAEILEFMLVYEIILEQSASELAANEHLRTVPADYGVSQYSEILALPLHYPSERVLKALAKRNSFAAVDVITI